MIRLCLVNKEGKKELADYILNTLGQSELSSEMIVIEKERKADMIIDLEYLDTKERVFKSMPVILRSLLEIKIEKMPKVKIQPGQKKIRK